MSKTLKTFLTENAVRRLPIGACEVFHNGENGQVEKDTSAYINEVGDNHTAVTHYHQLQGKKSIFHIEGNSGEHAQNALRAFLDHYGVHGHELPDSSVVFHHRLSSPFGKVPQSVLAFLTSPEEPRHSPLMSDISRKR